MAAIIGVAKAGCGATTLVSNLASPLVQLMRARHGPAARVLVVDADPRCGATELLTGRDPARIQKTLSTTLAGQNWLHETVIRLDDPGNGLSAELRDARDGVSLVPNNGNARVAFSRVEDLAVLRELLTETDLGNVRAVLIDCGSIINDLAESALLAADHIVAALTPNALDVHGLRQLIAKLKIMRGRFPGADLGSIVLTRVDRRHSADLGVIADLEHQIPDLVRTPHVPYSALVKTANNRHLPVSALPQSVEITGVFTDLATALTTAASI